MSIGLPVRNGARYLGEALASIQAQTFQDFEVIIGDNGSDDETPAICRSAAAADRRIRYVRHPQNLGAAGNYNWVAAQARGEFFRWATHDDVMSPLFLETCLAALEEAGPTTVLAFPRTTIIDADGHKVEDWIHEQAWRPGQVVQRRLADLLLVPRGFLNLCSPVAGLMRTAVLRGTRMIGPFNSSDKVLIVEMALRGDFVEVPDHLWLRRVHAGSSLQANASPAEVALWFDPRNRGAVLPQTRLLREYAAAIASAPIPRGQRSACLLPLLRWVASNRRWRVIGGECRRAALARGREWRAGFRPAPGGREA